MPTELSLEDYKCWICLEGNNDKPPAGQKHHAWKRPCGCNLVAHESCLLEWVSEVSSARTGLLVEDKLPRCPQCKSVIHVKADKSRFVALREIVESANIAGYRIFLFSTVGGSLASTIYTTLYALGATTIRCVCPTDMALDLLGITITEAGIHMRALSVKTMLLIPSIPMVLLMSGHRSPVVDTFLCLLPLTLADKETPPWKLRGPRLTVALLPVARIAYNMVYDAFVEPFIQSCATRVRPSYQENILFGGEPDRAGRAFDFRIEIQRDGEELNDPDNRNDNENVNNPARENGANADNRNENPNDNPENVRHGLADRLYAHMFNLLVRVLDRAIPPEQNPIENVGQVVEEDGAMVAMRRRDVRGTANWIFSKPSLTLWIGNALMFPVLSGLAGTALSSIPWVHRAIPSRFNRNIAGGILVILLRDIVNIATAYLKVKQQDSRRVLDYTELYNGTR